MPGDGGGARSDRLRVLWQGVTTHAEGRVAAAAVVVATGHGARDVFEWMQQERIAGRAEAFCAGRAD